MVKRVERTLNITYGSPKKPQEKSTHDDFRADDDYSIDVEYVLNGIRHKLSKSTSTGAAVDPMILEVVKQALGV